MYQIKSNLSLVADSVWRWSLSVVLFRFLMQIIVLVLFRAQLGAVDDHHLVKWHIEMFLRRPLETCRIYHNLETANANAGKCYELTSKKEEKELISPQYSFRLKNMSKGLNRETSSFDDWWKNPIDKSILIRKRSSLMTRFQLIVQFASQRHPTFNFDATDLPYCSFGALYTKVIPDNCRWRRQCKFFWPV